MRQLEQNESLKPLESAKAWALSWRVLWHPGDLAGSTGRGCSELFDKNADCGGGIVRSHPKLRLAQQPHPKISCKWLKLLSLDGLCCSPDLELGIVTGLYQMSLPVWWLHCQPAWPSFPLLLSLFWWHCCCLLPLLWLETILSAAAIWFPCSTITGCDYHHCRSSLGARRIY